MEFDKQKSHLSDLKKIEFEANTTSNSPIAEIPGIGEKTTQQMQEKNIYTIDDLVHSIQNDFKKLNLLTPAKVNNHTIFDALESYRGHTNHETEKMDLKKNWAQMADKFLNKQHTTNIQELIKIQQKCTIQ